MVILAISSQLRMLHGSGLARPFGDVDVYLRFTTDLPSDTRLVTSEMSRTDDHTYMATVNVFPMPSVSVMHASVEHSTRAGQFLRTML